MSRMFRPERTAAHDDPEGRPEEPTARADEADTDLGGLDDLADEFDVADEDTALEAEEEGAGEEAEAPAEEDYASGPDDALGLYLRQMGAIPLLNREKERALALRLEHQRNRFRRAALLCVRVLNRVAEKFDGISFPELSRAYAENLARLFVNEADLRFEPPRLALKLFALDRGELLRGENILSATAAEAAARRHEVNVSVLETRPKA